MICVPTPLANGREPDLSYLVDAATSLSRILRAGQLVVLESTSYPGTTRDRLRPILEESGLAAGRDFHLAFSPERIDPGRTDHTIRTTPKLVGGLTDACPSGPWPSTGRSATRSCRCPPPRWPRRRSCWRTSSARSTSRWSTSWRRSATGMGIDIWEVVDAAATKPFGFMRFEPGPGMGGHCLPVDPFYLAFKAAEHDLTPSSSSWPGRSTRPSPTSASSGSSARSTTSAAGQGRSRPHPRRRLQGRRRGPARIAGAEDRTLLRTSARTSATTTPMSPRCPSWACARRRSIRRSLTATWPV